MTMHPFLTTYHQTTVPKLKEQKKYVSEFAVPRVTKVSVNAGLGDYVGNTKAIEDISKLIATISGQKPVPTKARKAISGFKIREGMVIGLKATLRDQRMHDFLYKLIQVTLPRTRDFRGLVPTGVTADGNLNIGIRDCTIFPEASQGEGSYGLQVTVVSTARTLEEATSLYRSLGFIFQKEDEVVAKKPRSKNRTYKRS